MPGFGIPLSLIGALTLVSAAFVIGVVGMAAKARRRPVVSGTPSMLGAAGEVIEFSGGEGWAASTASAGACAPPSRCSAGQRVRVTRVDGLTLEVSPAAEAATSQGDRDDRLSRSACRVLILLGAAGSPARCASCASTSAASCSSSGASGASRARAW